MSTLSRRQFVRQGSSALAAATCLSATVDSIAGEATTARIAEPASGRAIAQPSTPNGGPPREALNIDDLVEQTHAFLVSLNAPELAPFLVEWPRTRERRIVQAASVSVVRWLPQVKIDAPASTASLIAELVRVAPLLAWRQTYKQPMVSASFLANYGYTELAGLSGPVPGQRLAWGFLLLGAGTTYPRHRHEAQEIYVPLSGTAVWQHGNQPWRDEPPGVVIHHVSDEPHAMRTRSQPLLALYLWRSDNLDQKSRLDPPTDA
jgi:Dimethlysulfonioproprionate lyase